jgi:formylglycine-generating enzyme required for sulfatase activity
MRYTFAVLFFGMYLMLTSVVANNIQVGNIAIVEQNTTAKQSLVQFDLTWDNSWRTSNLNGAGVTNWDAAWIFVKFRVGSGDWQHARLDATGHQTGTGTAATIDAGLLDPKTAFNATTNPAVGVFVYRQSDGTGAFIQNGIKICWNYGENGVADDATIDIKVFAIEMVYVPEGAFYLGSGGNEAKSFTAGPWTFTPGGGQQNPSVPFHVTSENAITIDNSAGNLWGTQSSDGESTIGDPGVLSADFPKGFAAFYCMKYEVTQKQYVDFLNTLNRDQQNTRTTVDISTGTTTVARRRALWTMNSSGNFIAPSRTSVYCDAVIPATGPVTFYCDLNDNGIPNESNDGQWLACSYLSYYDGAAFADWSGLRPMTEMEFEKACRGISFPVPNDFAWGDKPQYTLRYSLSDAGSANEAISSNYYSNPAGNYANTNWPSTNLNIAGPVRVGIFAGNPANTGRLTSGASFYGIMELSGNVWEMAVMVRFADGRNYTGNHGDGVLNTVGDANQSFWPAAIYNPAPEISLMAGIGIKGGAFNRSSSYHLVSYRAVPNSEVPRKYDYGFRAVRSKP